MSGAAPVVGTEDGQRKEGQEQPLCQLWASELAVEVPSCHPGSRVLLLGPVEEGRLTHSFILPVSAPRGTFMCARHPNT